MYLQRRRQREGNRGCSHTGYSWIHSTTRFSGHDTRIPLEVHLRLVLVASFAFDGDGQIRRHKGGEGRRRLRTDGS